MFSSTRLLLTLCATLCMAACSDITFQGGGPVTLKLSADKTAVAAGGTVTFSYEAKGTYLNGISIEYGDGAADSVFTQGAQAASGVVSHAFELPGSYTVVGRAEDGATGTATAQVVIKVGGA